MSEDWDSPGKRTYDNSEKVNADIEAYKQLVGIPQESRTQGSAYVSHGGAPLQRITWDETGWYGEPRTVVLAAQKLHFDYWCKKNRVNPHDVVYAINPDRLHGYGNGEHHLVEVGDWRFGRSLAEICEFENFLITARWKSRRFG